MGRAPLYGVAVLLCGLLCGCTAAPSAAPSASPSQPARSSSQTLVETYTASPDPHVGDGSRDIPAYQPDLETPLSYDLDGVDYTRSALRHFSLQGYSLVYDPATFIRQGWESGDAYTASPGNFISVSRLNGMDASTVRQGLALQENIPDQGQQVTVGSQGYTAHTLVASPQDGIFHQFWIVQLADHNTLLIEQSYEMDGPNAALYQALMQAMLDTLTLE